MGTLLRHQTPDETYLKRKFLTRAIEIHWVAFAQPGRRLGLAPLKMAKNDSVLRHRTPE